LEYGLVGLGIADEDLDDLDTPVCFVVVVGVVVEFLVVTRHGRKDGKEGWVQVGAWAAEAKVGRCIMEVYGPAQGECGRGGEWDTL
jgi:hypothetical protein